MTSCPTCGRTDFKSDRGMKRHHAMAHNESIRGERTKCSNCGDEIRVKNNKLEKEDNHYCDTECMGEHRSELYKQKGNPTWKGGKVHVECDWCGSTKEINQYKQEKQNLHFCNSECFSKYCSKNRVGEDNPRWDGGKVETKCDNCKKIIQIHESVYEKQEHHFCNQTCYGKWRSKELVGESSPSWKGGWERYYGKSWEKQRRLALERDSYKCRKCGMSDKECKEEHYNGLHVHHKTPFRCFDNHKEANRLNNLLTVCPVCHKKLEREITI